MIPEEHKMVCPTCGKDIDCRDLGQVFSHGFWNKETEKYECLTDEQIEKLNIEYYSSKRKGDRVEWTKSKKIIELN